MAQCSRTCTQIAALTEAISWGLPYADPAILCDALAGITRLARAAVVGIDVLREE